MAALQSVVNDINSLDEERVMRPGVGDVSLHKKRGGLLDELKEACNRFVTYAPDVSTSAVNAVASLLEAIRDRLRNLQNESDENYGNACDSVLQDVLKYKNDLLKHEVEFVIAELKEKGLLDGGDTEKYTEKINKMTAILDEKYRGLDDKIEEAEERIREAEKIELRARGEAADVSVEKAIENFKNEQDRLGTKALWWLIASAVSIAVLIGTVVCFITDAASLEVLTNEQHPGLAIYYTAIRITLLGILGAAATFCLRIYRSQLHMSNHNAHRQVVAASMQSFVDSATTKEHRDKILSILVEAVAAFGSSGLIRDRDDHMSSSKLIVDQFTNTISPRSGD